MNQRLFSLLAHFSLAVPMQLHSYVPSVWAGKKSGFQVWERYSK